ncbi:MAG: bifunctional diaminohydroxyphosphoribosylaminopyrimidine deaminase/5-amino-6-(5-phosphoribosylamino)uracil reductase RibD [Desulfovibrio sp.]|nr:bifunctional diaminohydroxyphosphoribosylaminopyrimidine deaminase/5-amino-6-(5-phosphoribosylamino)uracil reductase RibD [Desulfovibrio sp.]
MPEQEYTPFMRQAIVLAELGRWSAWPNPTVGAVLVRDNRIVASGFHRAAGEDHAEVACFKDAAARNQDTVGATLVVTLEPCNHQGRTPPCTQAILDAGIGRVVMGAADSNPLAAGGAARLRAAGLDVVGGVCEQECLDLVADFLVWQNTDRPYVILKMAATLDGRIATRSGQSQWISSDASREEVQKLRAGIGQCGGAVLIGGGTFRSDNPQLTARGQYAEGQQPLACVLTSRLPLPGDDFYLLKERAQQTVFLVSPALAASPAALELFRLGVRVLPLGPDSRGYPDFSGMLRMLRSELRCPYVLCEGGAQIGMALLEAGVVDEFRLHLAPMIFGDNQARPLFTGRSPLSLDEALPLRVSRAHEYGGDIHICLRPAVVTSQRYAVA